MSAVFDLIHTNDLGALIVILVCLGWLGSRVVEQSNSDFISTSVLRLTLGAFVVYLIGQIIILGAALPGLLVIRVLRAAIAAALAFCVLSIGFPIVVFVWQCVCKPIGIWRERRETDQREREQKRKQAEQQEIEARECTDRDVRNKQEYVEREAQQEAKTEEAAQRKLKADAIQRLILQLRFDCRIHYDSLPATTRNEFTIEELETYFQRFFNPELPADLLVDRAAKIKVMINARAESNDTGRFRSLEELLQHFEQQKQIVIASGMETDNKDTLIAELEMDKDRSIRELREAQ